jgi:nucleoside 2-deoxyribosyltransferase
MNVYIAAPLFSDTERSLNETITSAIGSAHDVHLPQRDGPLVEVAIAGGMSMIEAGRLAYESDIAAIRRCDVLVGVLDGRAMDEGVCFEMGFAKALGKRIVGFKTDVRRALPWGNNPMIEGCVDSWAKDPLELAEKLRQLSLQQ